MLPIGAQADEHEMVVCEADGSEVKSAEMCPPTLGERVITLEQRNQDVVLYGKIHNRIAFDDPADKAKESTTDFETSGSRIGIRAMSALGNGMTALGHYEFAIVTDKGTDDTFTRQGYVGLAGGFGKVTLGNQSTAFYNMHGGTLDPTNFVGPVGGAGQARSANTVKYSNAVGPLALEVDVRINGKGEKDTAKGIWRGPGAGVGLKVAAAEGITLGAAFNTEDHTYVDSETGKEMDGEELTHIGVSAQVALGQFFGQIGWTNEDIETATGKAKSDTDYLAAYFGAHFNDSIKGMIGYSQSEDSVVKTAGQSNSEPSKLMVGLYYSMGGGLSLSYEGASMDTDKPGEDNNIKHVVGLEYNF